MGCASSSADLSDKVEYLQSTPFMLQMNEDELSQFARHMTIRKYPTNTRVFAEGELGHEFFVIGSGEVDITARDSEKQEQFLCSKKKGDFFGEHGIMNDDKHLRTVTHILTHMYAHVLYTPVHAHSYAHVHTCCVYTCMCRRQ